MAIELTLHSLFQVKIPVKVNVKDGENGLNGKTQKLICFVSKDKRKSISYNCDNLY